MSDHIAASFATQLGELEQFIRSEWAWSSPEAGFALYVYHAGGGRGPLPDITTASWSEAGTIRHALVVASDANPGHRLAPGFPFPAAGAAIVCGWRPGADGLLGFRFGSPPDWQT